MPKYFFPLLPSNIQNVKNKARRRHLQQQCHNLGHDRSGAIHEVHAKRHPKGVLVCTMSFSGGQVSPCMLCCCLSARVDRPGQIRTCSFCQSLWRFHAALRSQFEAGHGLHTLELLALKSVLVSSSGPGPPPGHAHWWHTITLSNLATQRKCGAASA